MKIIFYEDKEGVYSSSEAVSFSDHFILGKRVPATHWIGGWV
jgi:hypothetical protein